MFLLVSVILLTPQEDGYCCGRYASYWNAFLYLNALAFYWFDTSDEISCVNIYRRNHDTTWTHWSIGHIARISLKAHSHRENTKAIYTERKQTRKWKLKSTWKYPSHKVASLSHSFSLIQCKYTIKFAAGLQQLFGWPEQPSRPWMERLPCPTTRSHCTCLTIAW